MTILRGFRYKLKPTPEQTTQFRQFAGVCRLVYNLGLEQRNTFYRQFERETGSRISYVSQARELTALRAEFDFVQAVSQTVQQQALRDLDRAFANFFAHRADHPTPRRKGIDDGFRFQGREVEVRRLNGKWSDIRLPKVGWVRFRNTRPMRGVVKNVTVSRDALGWHVSFACEIEHEVEATTLPAVGIDRGVANTLALSTGEMLCLPKSLDVLEHCHRAAQRVRDRRKKGSKRRLRAARRCAKLSARRARIRRDFHHKAALDIAKRFGTVVLEDLNIANMTRSAKGTVAEPGRNVRQKACLNRSILNQGWGAFATILDYKLTERGGALHKVDPRWTSQTCQACGCIHRESRESQSTFRCIECGHVAHADTNAAVEILRRNTSYLRMEGQRRPREVRTEKRLTPLGNPRRSRRGRC